MALKDRLCDALWKQIHKGLPGVKSEVQSGIKECNAKIKKLGDARNEGKEKHSYLHRISSKLTSMIQSSIDGVYAGEFFASTPGQKDAFDRRLRAHIQKILTVYAGSMCLHGHALEIVEDDQEPSRVAVSKFVMRSDYLKEVKKLMEECRGRELPGTFNPLVIGDLFSRQCQPWEQITQSLAEEVHVAASITFDKMIAEICDENTRGRLMKGLIRPALHELRSGLKEKMDEMLRPHLSIHPITYNDDLKDTVQKIQRERHNRMFDALSAPHCKFSFSQSLTATQLGPLLDNLKFGTCPNVEEYSKSLAADVAAAYYKVPIFSCSPPLPQLPLARTNRTARLLSRSS